LLTLTIITVLKYQFSDRFTKLFSLTYSDKYYTDYVKTNPLILNITHNGICSNSLDPKYLLVNVSSSSYNAVDKVWYSEFDCLVNLSKLNNSKNMI